MKAITWKRYMNQYQPRLVKRSLEELRAIAERGGLKFASLKTTKEDLIGALDEVDETVLRCRLAEYELETLIRDIGHRRTEELIGDFIVYEEMIDAPNELRSLSIDAMLVTEGDTAGEFKTKAELLAKLEELRALPFY